MQILLKKKDDGRNLRMTLNGLEKEISWESQGTFEANKKYYFIMGISNSSQLGKSLRALYIDSEGRNDFGVLSENFQYDFSPLNITMFSNNPNSAEKTSGHINLNRFMIMDSGSPAVNFVNFNGNNLIRRAVFNEDNVQDKICTLRGSYYENAGCLICEKVKAIANL